MKKEYFKPEITFSRFDVNELLTCSGDTQNAKCTTWNCNDDKIQENKRF